MQLAGTTLLTSVIVDEVSVLSPSVEPGEPLARVSWVGEIVRSPAAASADRWAAAGEVFYGKPGELLVRRNISQVIGVR